MCNVIYDIILFDIGFLFKISIYISNSSLSDSELSSWRTSSSQKSKVTVVTPQCDKVTDHCIGQLVARFRELDARGTYNFDRSGSRAGKKKRVPLRDSTARQPLNHCEEVFSNRSNLKRHIEGLEESDFPDNSNFGSNKPVFQYRIDDFYVKYLTS